MPRLLRSSLVSNRTSATEVLKLDLPVNPLSHIIITLDGYQMTDETTLAEFLAFINEIEVSHRGTTIVDVQSEDLAGLMTYLYRSGPVTTQCITTDNTARTLGLIIPFGRKPYDPSECFPATKKGELTLTLDLTVLGTSIDNGLLNVETVEILDATPSHYLKSVMQTVSAPGATGDNDVDLPIGNDIIALNVRMTTFPGASSSLYGVETAKILVDNVEHYFASARAEALVTDMVFRMAAKNTNMLLQADIIPANTVWLDFDPRGNDEYLLKTAGKSSVKARFNMGVNEATYVTVMELVSV